MSNADDYKYLYFKYKSKYTKLKQQFGGVYDKLTWIVDPKKDRFESNRIIANLRVW